MLPSESKLAEELIAEASDCRSIIDGKLEDEKYIEELEGQLRSSTSLQEIEHLFKDSLDR